MDIQKLLHEKLDQKISEIGPVIETHIDKMLESIIRDVFSSYGDMSKKVKQHIEDNLDISLLKIDKDQFNSFVANQIAEKLAENNRVTSDSIASMVASVMRITDPLKSITMEQFCRKIFDMKEDLEEITIEVGETETKYGSATTWMKIKIDDDKYQILVRDGVPALFMAYDDFMGRDQDEYSMILDSNCGVKSLLFKMKASRTQMIDFESSTEYRYNYDR